MKNLLSPPVAKGNPAPDAGFSFLTTKIKRSIFQLWLLISDQGKMIEKERTNMK